MQKWKRARHVPSSRQRSARSRSLRSYGFVSTLSEAPSIERRAHKFSETELRSTAEKFGVTNEIAFVPFQKNTAPTLRALDLVVHASTQPEPFGRTIAEAIACERAMIVADAGGAKEVVDASSASLIEPRSAEALARAIVDPDQNPGERARISREMVVLTRLRACHVGASPTTCWPLTP